MKQKTQKKFPRRIKLKPRPVLTQFRLLNFLATEPKVYKLFQFPNFVFLNVGF